MLGSVVRAAEALVKDLPNDDAEYQRQQDVEGLPVRFVGMCRGVCGHGRGLVDFGMAQVYGIMIVALSGCWGLLDQYADASS